MFTLGSDPEFFVSENGYCVPSVVKILDGEIKPIVDDPKHPVIVKTENFNVIVDGVALEVNFKTPFKSFVEIKENFWQAVELSRLLYKEVSVIPTIKFNLSQFSKYLGNELFFQGVIFGCDPDRDAFNVKWTARIIDALTHNLRYGGGHIHFGFPPNVELSEKDIVKFVRMCAVLFGNFIISNSVNTELVKLRAKYYGMPGKYRFQQYKNGQIGVEYRTPSNDWLNFDNSKIKEMDDLADILYQNFYSKKSKLLEKEILNATVEAISTANKEMSKQILDVVLQ